MRWILLLFSIPLLAYEDFEASLAQQIVKRTKRIDLVDFPESFNPSIFKVKEGYLFSFRYCPNRYQESWLSFIGVVLLNENFEPISSPQLLNTRYKNSKVPSQSEDARLFSYRGRVFLIYNDNTETISTVTERRHLFMAELHYKDGQFSLSTPLKLIYEDKYNVSFWQKNWVPFEWNQKLFLTYTINPHEVIYPNLKNGACYPCYETFAPLEWDLGPLRGSTPPQLVDGEYLAFFHSGAFIASDASYGQEMWHYFMGAYTFSKDPPFALTKFTPLPIVGEGFYTPSWHIKRVIFPGGFVVDGSSIYVAYGKDDYEMWIAELDKEALTRALVPIENITQNMSK